MASVLHIMGRTTIQKRSKKGFCNLLQSCNIYIKHFITCQEPTVCITTVEQNQYCIQIGKTNEYMHCSFVLYTLWMTTAVLLHSVTGFIMMNERMFQQLFCRWTEALVAEEKSQVNSKHL